MAAWNVSKTLRDDAFALAAVQGILLVDKNNSNRLVHVPFTLCPSPFPRSLFAEAKDVQTDFNALIHALGRDIIFLNDTLAETVLTDPFTCRLVDIYKKFFVQKRAQRLTMGIFRSDYMVSEFRSRSVLRQVEINTIASSFAFLCEKVSRVQRMLIQKHGMDGVSIEDMSENKTFASIPAAFARAVVLYEYRCGMRAQMSRDSLTSDPALKTELNRAPAKTVILFVVQDMERNISDQRFLEFELLMRYGIKSVRKTLEELGRIKEKVSFGSPLVVDGAEVAVAYFRAGYAPDDYVDEVSWDGREIVEMSRVIKCPDIATHLLGTKKVQQVLAKDGIVERYLLDEDAANRVRNTFSIQYGLGAADDDREDGIKEATSNPTTFVLKPQREGGGNNIYGEQIREFITKSSAETISAYILQERFFPPIIKTLFLKDGEILESDIECELGIFGALLADDDEIFINEESGYLLRSKVAKSDETGVAAGFGMIDSVHLV